MIIQDYKMKEKEDETIKVDRFRFSVDLLFDRKSRFNRHSNRFGLLDEEYIKSKIIPAIGMLFDNEAQKITHMEFIELSDDE